MTHLRERWEGVSLSGDYTLEQWLNGDDRAAFFQTSLAPDGRRAIVKLVPEAAVNGAVPLDLWHRTRQLRHPNLIELIDCGRADRSGEIVLYAVFESPDDTLTSALSHAPLNSQESREVLDSILGALRYLHAQGLVLGALDPDHIVAVGDRIKLSTDALRDADTSSAYAEDVRLLGDLWKRALMPASPKSLEIAAHAADPNPQARWTLAEISAALNPPVPTAPPAVNPRVNPSVNVLPPPLTLLSPVSVPPVSVPPASVPPDNVRNEATALPPSHRRTLEPATAYHFPKWIFVGAAAVLLLILGLNLPRRADVATRSPVASVSRVAESPVPAPLPDAGVPSREVPKAAIPKAAIPKATVPKATVSSGAAPRVAAPRVAAPTEPKPSPVGGKAMWRVIAFTYRTRDAAAKKVEQLNQNHPGLNAAVFSTKDKRGYYLVSLGGRMTHEDALRLQRTAKGKGLPRDLYVQNYSE